jgi:hypothetical protein
LIFTKEYGRWGFTFPGEVTLPQMPLYGFLKHGKLYERWEHELISPYEIKSYLRVSQYYSPDIYNNPDTNIDPQIRPGLKLKEAYDVEFRLTPVDYEYTNTPERIDAYRHLRFTDDYSPAFNLVTVKKTLRQ